MKQRNVVISHMNSSADDAH